jgi:hypothetical protein
MRKYQLDMNYPSMWSILDDVSDKEIEEEKKIIGEKMVEINKQYIKYRDEYQNLAAKANVLEQTLSERKRVKTAEKLEITEDHLKLLKYSGISQWKGHDELYFPDYKQVAEILEWKLPNDDLSDDQYEEAKKLIYEMPFVINKIIKQK